MEQITSKENRWVKEYIKLSSSKSYRQEKQKFVVESVKLVKEAFENNVSLEMVFVTLECMDKKQYELEKLFQTQHCVIISKEIEKKLSQAKSSQGIFAICSNIDNKLYNDKIYHSGKYVMLVNLQDAGNVGTIIRTAEAVGMDGVIITKSTCDFLNPKVIRGSMGSVFRMPILIIENEFEFLKTLKTYNVKTYASVLDKNAIKLSDVNFSSPFVLLIGNEGNGLDNEVISLCSEKITIKMNGNAESLNASMAAGFLMYEATKTIE